MPLTYVSPPTTMPQVLADFLRLMHQRKEEEVQHVNSQICDVTQDIQLVRVCVCLCVLNKK